MHVGGLVIPLYLHYIPMISNIPMVVLYQSGVSYIPKTHLPSGNSTVPAKIINKPCLIYIYKLIYPLVMIRSISPSISSGFHLSNPEMAWSRSSARNPRSFTKVKSSWKSPLLLIGKFDCVYQHVRFSIGKWNSRCFSINHHVHHVYHQCLSMSHVHPFFHTELL